MARWFRPQPTWWAPPRRRSTSRNCCRIPGIAEADTPASGAWTVRLSQAAEPGAPAWVYALDAAGEPVWVVGNVTGDHLAFPEAPSTVDGAAKLAAVRVLTPSLWDLAPDGGQRVALGPALPVARTP